jgi:membrane associated rhomboid family serine protease
MESAPITLLLLAANALVSGYAFFMDPSLMERFSFRPRRVLEHEEYYRFISGGFVHAGIAHLAFNMITLYFFGPNLESLLGPLRFLGVYFGAELAAHAVTLYMHRNDPHYAAVGASGAISGVLFGFCLFYPFSKIYLFFVPIGIPALVFAPGYVLISIYAMREGGRQSTRGGRGGGGGIAHEAHVGGAIGGLLLTILLEPRAIPLFLQQLL